MYTPQKTIIRSDFAQPPALDSSYFKEAQRTHLAAQERKYQETNDFYDLQREEMQDLSKVLEGTTGADHQYLNKLVVDVRDEYKETLRGLKLKDYNTPEVQDKIFEIKNRLVKAKNLSTTSLEHIKQAYMLSKQDHMKEGEFTRYLTQQLALPPDQRDPDLLNRVQTDPLFFNGYDYLTSVLDGLKTTTEPLQRKDDNFFYSYEATYRPELGYFDKNGQWVFEPKGEVIDQALTNPLFYNTVVGLMPPELVKSLTDSGNKTELKKAVKERAKEYMHEVFVREEEGKTVTPFDPELKQKGRTLNPLKYQRPTAGQRDKQTFEREVMAIQQRLQNDNPLAFDEYISPDGWRGFTFEYDDNGKINKIIGTMVDKSSLFYGKLPGDPPTRIEEIPVNIDDEGSVQQALSRIKFVFSKDKDEVTAEPMTPPAATQKSKPKIKGF